MWGASEPIRERSVAIAMPLLDTVPLSFQGGDLLITVKTSMEIGQQALEIAARVIATCPVVEVALLSYSSARTAQISRSSRPARCHRRTGNLTAPCDDRDFMTTALQTSHPIELVTDI